jgi:hypothetical protein
MHLFIFTLNDFSMSLYADLFQEIVPATSRVSVHIVWRSKDESCRHLATIQVVPADSADFGWPVRRPAVVTAQSLNEVSGRISAALFRDYQWIEDPHRAPLPEERAFFYWSVIRILSLWRRVWRISTRLADRSGLSDPAPRRPSSLG